MSAPRPVAVVVPSWNSVELLPRCLDSLRGQGVDLELLVVDNGSSDGSVAYLERRGTPHVALPRNTGFAAAVNLGAGRVSAPAILALNADTALEPGCVGALLEALAADSSLGGVQPRILQLEGEARPGAGGRAQGAGGRAQGAGSRAPGDSGPAPGDGGGSPGDGGPAPGDVAGGPPGGADAARLYSAGQALTRDGRAFEIGAGEAQSPPLLRPREVFGVCGAACLLRRRLFTELGGYDESYFSFYEDVDLNVRARIAGWRFAYVPEAVVWHVGNASWQAGFERPGAENARLVARNRLATQAKFVPARALPRAAAVEVGALARAAAQRRLRPTLAGKLAALRRLPRLLRERRRLRREGDPSRARHWLGRR